MRKITAATAWLAFLSAGPVLAAQPGTKLNETQAVDRSILHVQVILDHLGFSPGMLDGRTGKSLTAALKGFQESRGLKITGEIDPATLSALHP